MARVASCPQCNHELLVPSEAESESWAKCPECRAFFQVKQATSRELLTALLVDPSEQEMVVLDSQGFIPQTATLQDEIETAVAPPSSSDDEIAATQDDDLELDDLTDEPPAANALEKMPASPDEFQTLVIEQDAVDRVSASLHGEPRELHSLIEEPKKGDELEAAAQRIDDWFRSAKTVPDTSPVGETSEPAAAEESRSDMAHPGPSRTNATLDMDEIDADDLAAIADFNLDEPDDGSSTKTIADRPAWDDTAQMEDLLGDADIRPEDEFVAELEDADDADAFAPEFVGDDSSSDVEAPTSGEERPSINLFADNDSAKVDLPRRRAPRRERSFARSLVMILVAGLVGLCGGYYALLWLRGPNIDFLHVAHYLPKAMLPGSFDQPMQMPRSVPPAIAADTTADEPTEPQEFPPAADETAERISDVPAATDTAPADAADQPAEVQAGFSEPATDEPAPDSAVGDRYAPSTSDTETGAANESTATGVTSEKPATTDLSVDDLAPPESDDAEPAEAQTANEPATFDVTPADPLADIATASEPTESVEIKIANAPAFTGDDLRTSLETAVKAQPQLVAGNFADSAAIAQAKGRSYAVLADLAQKAMFADASQASTQPLVMQADELFRTTLADARTRGEVAQILPRWIQSPNRKHGGVFAGGKIVRHAKAGSVVECVLELDGGKQLTVLAPANAAENADLAKPMAIVGWIVDAPTTQVSGYTGTVKSPAIWTEKLTPLE